MSTLATTACPSWCNTRHKKGAKRPQHRRDWASTAGSNEYVMHAGSPGDGSVAGLPGAFVEFGGMRALWLKGGIGGYTCSADMRSLAAVLIEMADQADAD